MKRKLLNTKKDFALQSKREEEKEGSGKRREACENVQEKSGWDVEGRGRSSGEGNRETFTEKEGGEKETVQKEG